MRVSVGDYKIPQVVWWLEDFSEDTLGKLERSVEMMVKEVIGFHCDREKTNLSCLVATYFMRFISPEYERKVEVYTGEALCFRREEDGQAVFVTRSRSSLVKGFTERFSL
jgi:hypothetical protein